MAASLFLTRTRNVYLSVDCALGPLWNPIRLAEDIAFVDAMSGGRLLTTVGLGYRAVEYEALAVDFTQRGAAMDRVLERMLKVWSGTPLVAGDRTRPSAREHGRSLIHRCSLAAECGRRLRRAARFGLGLGASGSPTGRCAVLR